jgi:hypothetical protein
MMRDGRRRLPRKGDFTALLHIDITHLIGGGAKLQRHRSILVLLGKYASAYILDKP